MDLHSVPRFHYLILQVLYKCVLTEGFMRKINSPVNIQHQALIKNVKEHLLKSSSKQAEK